MRTIDEKRKKRRVQFTRGVDVELLAIDGTWRRSCRMLDAAESGAKLSLSGPPHDLQLQEFFLVLSARGGGLQTVLDRLDQWDGIWRPVSLANIRTPFVFQLSFIECLRRL